jgi:metal-dependent amidase/aminoacylase/carboxypeptidase family protein
VRSARRPVDLHTAIGVGGARALAQGPEPVRGRLVFVSSRPRNLCGARGRCAPHTPDFAAEERAIGLGVRAMTGLLTDRLAAVRSVYSDN